MIRDEYVQKDASRNMDGNVPNVNWNPNYQKVNVDWYNVGNSNPQYGLRREVSAKNPVLDRIFCKVFYPPVYHL